MKGSVGIGTDGFTFVVTGFTQTAVTAAAMTILIPITKPQPSDFECTLTMVYAVATEELDAIGTWNLRTLDGDGTSTVLVAGTVSGITIATHTATWVFNSVPLTALGMYIAMEGIDGGVGAGSVIRGYSLRYQCKRRVEWVKE